MGLPTLCPGLLRLWTPFLLYSHFAVCGALPAPANISITSIDMEHTLHFLPGAGTPDQAQFRVHVSRLRRKVTWKPVAQCLALTASQSCNLTSAFKYHLDHYRVRVQAFTATETSDWAESTSFHPIENTVLGPPEVAVSGCGNCLILQVGSPAARGPQQHRQLQDLYRGLRCLVRRTRDGAQFSLRVPYQENTKIEYLQPGVEYCVTVSVETYINQNIIPSEPHCSFTSPPPANSSVHVVLILLAVFCVLAFLLIGSAVYGGRLGAKLLAPLLPGTLVVDPTCDDATCPPRPLSEGNSTAKKINNTAPGRAAILSPVHQNRANQRNKARLACQRPKLWCWPRKQKKI